MLRLLLPALLVTAATVGVARRADRLRPWLATWTLTVLSAAAFTAVAGAATAIIVDQLAAVPWLAERVGWCVKMAGGPAPLAAVVSTLLGATAATVNLTRTAGRHRADIRGFGDDPVVVVPTTAVAALAVPGRSGRSGQIVVTTGMLEALDADERRAMFAHELAHLQLRHHLFLRVSGLAAAALPILRPVALRVRFATERWADERAAREVGSRSLVARAVSKGALAVAAIDPVPKGSMALNGSSTEARITALSQDCPSSSVRAEAAVAAVATLIVGLAVTQLHHLATLALHAC